ncbi:hypothetical protein FOA43_003323 [Brettanomyces nanus]|uniref:Ribonuclease P protein subunit n=1 Tax=Eeniella nana TaxID=13502 RepID=A0A875RW00_EENNA|nr:uncharacterized protein FOA43_003323 [Brettanomyces nanus]QPG75937.1 hypothetical protein FOA43_003323 [Brettanomyces nanus]
MNRDNSIEKLILSRCSKYNDDGQIMKVLEERYSLTGAQKNFLVLEPTDGGVTREEINHSSSKKRRQQNSLPSIMHSLQNSQNSEKVEKRPANKHNPLKTKNEFKRFMKSNLALQAKIMRKLKLILKKNPHYLDKVKDLASLNLCNKILKFEDFIEINRLWNSYIKETIGSTENIMNISTKLSMCEFIGAYIEVTHSGCVDNVGKCGIVIWESQHNFVIVVPRKDGWKNKISLIEPKYSLSEKIGGIRLINKQDTRFKVTVNLQDNLTVDYEIIGDRLMIRSIDRANKKFKSHNVRDIRL